METFPDDVKAARPDRYDRAPSTSTDPKETLPHVREPTQRPTMLDVAALAGVGLTTVSRVVNGKAGVSPATIARVNSAIERLEYRHNVNASALRRSDPKNATI